METKTSKIKSLFKEAKITAKTREHKMKRQGCMASPPKK